MAQTHDVAVIGAGFGGLLTGARLRELGVAGIRLIDKAADVGGTWYWNRYPGARVDIPSLDYMFSFDPDWHRDWQWSEKYATQPEILGYLNHVADKFDLRRDIQFDRRVLSAHWQEAERHWQVTLDDGTRISARFVVAAIGALSDHWASLRSWYRMVNGD